MVQKLNRILVIFVVFIFVSITVLLTTFLQNGFGSTFWYISGSQSLCLEENEQVYIHGKLTCETRQRVKYLSYHPSGGGWNNQRRVLENAVILAKLLNRTLIVHPLAPNKELLQVKRPIDVPGGYEKYNMLPRDKLIPLSRVIDLKLLSKLLPVKEFRYSHAEFQKAYINLKWTTICHNPMVGAWVDVLPNPTDEEKWKVIRQQMENLPSYENIPRYRHICREELEKFKADGHRPVWGIMDELPHKYEDLMYFSEGCLRIPRLFFFDKKTVLEAHDWVMQFINLSPQIRKRAEEVLEVIQQPFNAVHVRRTDFLSKLSFKQDHWLQKLKEQKALNFSNTLYVATDERNKTWFRPFRQAGFTLFFADDFDEQLEFKDLRSIFVQDMAGLCEQLICAHADIFVGSYYSSFSMTIEKLRQQFKWKKGMLLEDSITTFKWLKMH